ncbi:MAG: exopolyphosphatase [Thiothrix nivea]|nr:MAG: exopolyphosphatase [Thiothrix nivea]
MSTQNERKIAAIDLGSNSFHMIVAGVDELGHMRILDKLRESVRLRSGLDENKNLSAEVKERALACLQRFGERIRDFPSADVTAVGTNTLRQTRKARRFLDEAERALGHPVSVISGREEARLIYLGVSHMLAEEDSRQRFVMDIGGGSTELIIGRGFEASHLESLHMGCVSSSQRFFPDGQLEKSCWKQAMTAARLELMPIQRRYRQIGWDSATGASGTIKSVMKMIHQSGLSEYRITLEHMKALKKRMIDAGHISRLDIPGLSDERKPVIAGGLAILLSTFEALEIEEMLVSEGALREGLVYDCIDRLQYGDLRSKTVQALQQRFQIEVEHATTVRRTAEELFDACADDWKLTPELRELLGWAADLHELGLSVSHSSYHKHGAYLLENMDLTGFSSEEQAWLSVLVRTHRRKIPARYYDDLESERFRAAPFMSVILRLAVLLHRSRGEQALELKKIRAGKRELALGFAAEDTKRPLLFADLEEERHYLKVIDFKLNYRVDE